MTKLMDRLSLLAKEELQIVEVILDKGQSVFVRQMTGRERDLFEQTLIQEKKDDKGEVTYEKSLGDFRAKLSVQTICNAEGDLLLLPEDYETLSKNMSAARLEKIVNVAQELNKISEQDKENLVKNSVGDQVANSSSDFASN